MRKLFVSFTTTLRALKDGSVTENDLDTAIFYFGCCREHALDPWKDEANEILWFFRDDVEKGRAIHARLVAAIEKAEVEKRIAWRTREERSSYKVLNSLLVANGFGGIAHEHDDRICNADYCYPGVEDRVKEAKLDLQVVT